MRGIRNFAGGIFLLGVRTWGGEGGGGGGGGGGGVILRIWTIFENRKQHSVNTEHQLKSKIAWAVCQKSMKLKQK